MNIPGISPTASLSAPTDTASRLPQKVLGQADFLKLLVTQLTQQDPLNPQKDTEFIAQMAQFSSLEQTKTMESDMAKLRTDQQLLSANTMLGRQVVVQSDNNATVTGIVNAVNVQAGKPTIEVDGQNYDLSKVLSLSQPVPGK